jgi:hypothetical protein
VTVAIGLELSADTDMAAIAVAGADGGRWLADLMFYGSPDDAVAECSRLYTELEDNCGVFADPMPCAGILDGLRAAVWLHELSAEDVAAAAWQFTTEVRARRVKLAGHPALRESMRAAVPRPLAVRFAFERKRVTSDMSPLNASALRCSATAATRPRKSPACGCWTRRGRGTSAARAGRTGYRCGFSAAEAGW